MQIVEGWIRFAPGDLAPILAPAKPLLAATRNEAGCQSCVFSIDVEDPNVLRLTEVWQDEAALEAHAHAPHVAAFAGLLRNASIEAMNVKCYSGEFQRTLMQK